jgi:microcystin-dependent protein
MWSGSIASIPAGWYLCDGLNSTPDLRDRFVVGAGTTYAVAATGGSPNAIVVSHTHTATVTDPGHSHSYTSSTFNCNQNSGQVQAGVATTGTTASNTTGITVGISTTGSSATNANLPPYYALAYIMKA